MYEKPKYQDQKEIDSQSISFYLVEGTTKRVLRIIPLVLQVEDNPKMFKEAMASCEITLQNDAINDEINFIMSNHT